MSPHLIQNYSAQTLEVIEVAWKDANMLSGAQRIKINFPSVNDINIDEKYGLAVMNYNVTYYEKINDALDLIEPDRGLLMDTLRKIGIDESFEISPDITAEKLKFKTDGKANDASQANNEEWWKALVATFFCILLFALTAFGVTKSYQRYKDQSDSNGMSDSLHRAMSVRGFFKSIQNPLAARVYQSDASVTPITSSIYNKAFGSLRDSFNRLKVTLSNPIFSDGSETTSSEEYVTDIYYTSGNSGLIIHPTYLNSETQIQNKTWDELKQQKSYNDPSKIIN